MASSACPPQGGYGSQTLSRGLAALAMIGESDVPLSVGELATRLGVHRSGAYRIVRTLEDHRFVVRNAAGEIQLGVRLAALARNVSRDLQSAALPELTAAANELGMTAFVVAYDGVEAVTLTSVEPRFTSAPIAQRPGSRHPIDRGAPGRVIRSQLVPDRYPPAPYETSHDEIFVGLTSIAVPIPVTQPASLAVLFVSHDVDVHEIARRLRSGAARIAEATR